LISIPIEKLGDTADKIAEGNFDVEVKATSKDEIGELALRFENMRQRIKTSNEKLEQKDKLKEEFMSMITHELKSPLTPITGYCEALKRPEIMGPISEKQTRAVDTIYSNVIKLRKLIMDVLDAQKLDLGKMKFDNDEFEIDKLIKNVINDFKFTVEAKKIQLVTSMKEKLILKSDRQRIGQVLSNLLYNAVDFIPEEKGVIELRVEEKADKVIFSVKDNGPGIPDDEQKNIFVKFFQVDTSVTRKHGGTGIGLSVCQGIVENLGGRIWVESELGKGSTFYFSIPKHEEE
jgi:signal transduction histidine kinase